MKSVLMKRTFLAVAVLLQLSFVGCTCEVERCEREYEYELSRQHPQPPALVPAPLASLTSDKEVIVQGETITLRWHTENATAVRIEGIGEVSASGLLSVIPTSTTTYHLIAEGPGGVDVATVWISVTPLPPMM